VFDRLQHTLFLAQANLGGGQAASTAPAAGAGAGAGAAGAPVPQPDPFQPLIFIGAMLVIFYFLLIRPQQKRAKKHRALLEGLQRGDHVITASGIFGKIKLIEDNTVTIEIAQNTQIKILKSHVGGLSNPETEKQLTQTAGQS